jgi:hypothetical protein
MQVRIQDWLAYQEYLIVDYTKKQADKDAIYEKNKAEYESGKWAKFWGFKYENSDDVRFGWWNNYHRLIKDCNTEINKVTYLRKANPSVHIDCITCHISNSEDFCNWAAENNIPY